jgi:hypothetical protein
MRAWSGRPKELATALLLPAFLASAPAIQVCTVRSAESAAFYRCLIFGPALAVGVAVPTRELAARDEGREVHDAKTCRSDGATCASGSCPLVREVTRRGTPDRVPIYCIGDPAGGHGVRSHVPRIVAPGQLVAVVTTAAECVPRPIPAQSLRTELRARPPTFRPGAPPPVRGPPSIA